MARLAAKAFIVLAGLFLVALVAFVAQSMAIEQHTPKPAGADSTCYTFRNGQGGGWVCERPSE